MTREEFKLMAHGKFAMQNVEGTINKQDMKFFVEGALFAFDMAMKCKELKGKIEIQDPVKPEKEGAL